MAFSVNGGRSTEYPYKGKMNLEPYLTANTKIKSRWLVDVSRKGITGARLNENTDYLS